MPADVLALNPSTLHSMPTLSSLHLLVHLKDPLHRWPFNKLLMPLKALRILCLPIEVCHQHRRQRIPGNEHEIRIADFVADEVFRAGFGEV